MTINQSFPSLAVLSAIAILFILFSGCQGSQNTPAKPSPPKTAQVDSRGAPDPDLIEELARQPASKARDTAFKHLSFQVKRFNINFKLYMRFKNFVGSKLKLKKQVKAYIQTNQLNINPDQSYNNLQLAIGPNENQDRRGDLVKIFTDTGSYLCHLKNFNDAGLPQHKIVYIWGSKSYYKRSASVKPMNCGYKYHGLDCSGLICQLLHCAGITINDVEGIGSADNLSQPKFLQKYLKQFFGTTKFRVDTLHIGPKKIITGDFICFNNVKEHKVSHIGIALRNDFGTISLLQCLGSYPPKYCKLNIQNDHGILSSDLTDYLKNRPDYFIERITQLP